MRTGWRRGEMKATGVKRQGLRGHDELLQRQREIKMEMRRHQRALWFPARWARNAGRREVSGREVELGRSVSIHFLEINNSIYGECINKWIRKCISEDQYPDDLHLPEIQWSVSFSCSKITPTSCRFRDLWYRDLMEQSVDCFFFCRVNNLQICNISNDVVIVLTDTLKASD